MSTTDKTKYLYERLKTYPNFPKPGVNFQDIFSLLRDPLCVDYIMDIFMEFVSTIENIEAVVALDSRGFFFGSILSHNLKVPFVPIRKKGKLPGKTKAVEYTLEYGEDTLEIQEKSLTEGQRVIVIDDLLATGGTLNAACELIELLGAVIVKCLVVMEIKSLDGREMVPTEVISILQV